MQSDISFASFLRERRMPREPAGMYTIWMNANPDYYDHSHHITNILAIDPCDFGVVWGHSSLTYQGKGQIGGERVPTWLPTRCSMFRFGLS